MFPPLSSQANTSPLSRFLLFVSSTNLLLDAVDLVTLTVRFGSPVTVVDNQILRAVVVLAGEVALEDSLGAISISLLGIQRSSGHVGGHGVAEAEGVDGGAERVVAGGGLGEPDITTVAGEVAGAESLGDVLLDDDGATGGVDEVGALLHLADELLVEEALCLLVQRAVDGDNVALGEHLLEGVDAAAANLGLDLGLEALVVKVQQLLASERLEAAQDTLTDAADGDGADNLALEVVLLLGDGGDVPLAAGDLLVGGHEVAEEDEDGHDDVLGDGDDVGAGDLGDGDAAVGLVGGDQVDVVGADTSGDGDLEVLGLGQTLSGQVTGVEAIRCC